eukprot:m.341134 g.341134  ORF g.341134 m.341134 type:complete len:403 (-) comp19855_c0_seq1:29-1237(-)
MALTVLQGALGVSLGVLVFATYFWNKLDCTGNCDYYTGVAAINRSANPPTTQLFIVKTEKENIGLHPGTYKELTLNDFDTSGFQVHFSERTCVYNPGIYFVNNQAYLVARLEGKNGSLWTSCPERSLTTPFPCPVKTLRMISFVVTCTLSSSLSPTSKLEGLEFNFRWDRVVTKTNERQLGPEDPRIFKWGSSHYVAVNGPPIRDVSNGRNVRCMKIQQIFPNKGPPIDLDLIGSLDRIEKNWSPISEHLDGYLFSRTLDPHRIVVCNHSGICSNLVSTNHSLFFKNWMRVWNLKAIHLGTNAVRLKSGHYMAILHGIGADVSREYLNFVYVFRGSSPWEIIGLGSEPLALPVGSIMSGYTFTTNLVLQSEKAIICYCVKDRTSSFFVTTIKNLTSSLRQIS